MPDEDQTPTRPYEALRQPIGGAPLEATRVDEVWFREWKRGQERDLRELRADLKEAMRGIESRLSGIEGRLNDGDATIRKHEHQLGELIDQGAEHDRRLRAVEAHQFDALQARLATLEESDRERRAREEGRKEAKLEADAATERSLWAKSRDAVVISAAGGVGLAIIGLLGWLVAAYARSATP